MCMRMCVCVYIKARILSDGVVVVKRLKIEIERGKTIVQGGLKHNCLSYFLVNPETKAINIGFYCLEKYQT